MSWVPGVNLSRFVYLHPELAASNLLTTVDQARSYLLAFENGGGDSSALFWGPDPPQFNAKVFLAHVGMRADVSPMGRAVRKAMRDQGLTDAEIVARSEHVANLNCMAKRVSSERAVASGRKVSRVAFHVQTPPGGQQLAAGNLAAGDVIAVAADDRVKASGEVRSVDYAAQRVEVDFPVGLGVDPADYEYSRFVGVRVPDADRVGAANYARGVRKPAAPEVVTSVDLDFNLWLYRSLYSDARAMSLEEAYTDYVARQGTADARIGYARDIPVAGVVAVEDTVFQNIVVNGTAIMKGKVVASSVDFGP